MEVVFGLELNFHSSCCTVLPFCFPYLFLGFNCFNRLTIVEARVDTSIAVHGKLLQELATAPRLASASASSASEHVQPSPQQQPMKCPFHCRISWKEDISAMFFFRYSLTLSLYLSLSPSLTLPLNSDMP